MKSIEMDVNKQIKEKLKIFQEIDKTTRTIVETDKNKSISNQTNKTKQNSNKSNTEKDTKYGFISETLKNNKNPNCKDGNVNLFSKINVVGKETYDLHAKNSNKFSNCKKININLNDEIENLRKSVSFNNIDPKKFVTKNNQLMNKNYRKINLEENVSKIMNNAYKGNERSNSKSRSKIEKTANKRLEKTNNKETIPINNNNKQANNPKQIASPIKSILKNRRKDKLFSDEKFVPFHETINMNSDFLQRNKKIIFNDIVNKVVPKNSNSTINHNFKNSNLNQRDYNKNIYPNNKKSDNSSVNLDKSNYSNFFSNHSPIRDRKSPLFSSSFINESDGMNNIFLNKDKNLTILNLEKLYQGSFNREFCELYSNNNNNNIQNDSTMNKTMQQTVNQKNFSSNNYSKSDLKNSNFDIKGNNTSKKIENKTNFDNNAFKTNTNINNNSNVPIQELNKFFTKRANYNNLNYFSNKKTENSKSREYYNTYENQKNMAVQTSAKKTFNNKLNEVKSNSNNKNLNSSSNNKDFPTFNNNNQQNENDILIHPTFDDKNNKENNQNVLISDRKINDSDDNNIFIGEENYNSDKNPLANNKTVSNFFNYRDYNNPFLNEKEDTKKYCEKLSNYHFVYKNKLEKIRKGEKDKRCKSANPMLTKKAQNIVREGHLFHCRLYPYHKLQAKNMIKKPNHSVRNTYYNHNHNNININNVYYYNSINNCNSGSFIIENLRRLEGIEDIKTYQIYRTSKNQEYLSLKDNKNITNPLNKSYNNMSCSMNLNEKNALNNFNNNSILANNSASNFKRTNSLNRSFNCPKNSNNPFTFKPNLNLKSLNIAEKLTPAFIRLTEKASNKKKPEDLENNNNNNIFKSKEKNLSSTNPNFSYDAILLGRNSNNNSRNFYKPRSNSKGEFNRSFELYRRGVQKLKKKEALHMQKILIEEESYKQFPFKPQINENYPAMFLAARAYKAENIDNPNDLMSNMHNINYGIYLKKTNFKKNEKNDKTRNYGKMELNIQNDSTKSNKQTQINNNIDSKTENAYYDKFIPEEFFSNKSHNHELNVNNNNKILRNNSISFYDKNIYWKQNVLKKFNKMRDEKEEELHNIHTFKPEIHKVAMAPDARFIEKNIDQIQEYVNKRRSYLQKANEEVKYQNSKYYLGENFKIKTTIPKEFNLSYKTSQERLLNRSTSNISRAANKSSEAFGFSEKKTNQASKNTKELLSSSYAFKTNVKNKHAKKFDANNLRNNLKIKEFFEFNETITPDSARTNLKKEDRNDSKNPGSIKRSADLFSKNKSFATTQNLNRSFNNLQQNPKTSHYKTVAPKNLNINFNNVNQEIILPPNFGSDLIVSDQIHKMPKDNYYHHNNLHDFNSQIVSPSLSDYPFFAVNNSDNVNVFNNQQAAGNFHDGFSLGNIGIDGINRDYPHNLQVNNFYVENLNNNFKE